MKTTYKNFIISAEFVGEKSAPWDIHNDNHYKVKVKNTENNKRTSFDFWQSIANPNMDNEQDLIESFFFFVSDAVYGTYELDEFFNEFGYEKISEGLKAFNGCRSAYNKMLRLLGDKKKIFDLCNELSDIIY